MTSQTRRGWELWAVVGALVLLLIGVAVQKVYSADLWWQIRNGEWIIEHADVPTTEMYSYTASGAPLREMRWVYCVVIAKVWSLGEWAPSLVQALLVSMTWGVLLWPHRRVLGHPAIATAVILGLVGGSARWVMRPELVTYLMTAAFVVVLDHARRAAHAGKGSSAVWALPVLQVVWVNTHTTFVFGPLLCLAFLLGDGVARWVTAARAARAGVAGPRALHVPLLGATLLVIGGCWVNPYGHSGAMYALQMYRETSAGHATKRLITEMRSPLEIPLASWGWDFWACAGLIVLAATAAGWSAFIAWRESRDNVLLSPDELASRLGGVLIRLGLVGLAAYLFTMLQRNTPMTAILGTWVVCSALSGAPAVSRAAFRAASLAASLGAVAVAWFFVTDRYAVARDLPREWGLGIVRWYQPRGAERFILERAPKGNLFNVVRDGSYFVHRVAAVMPVYIDGRTDAYGPAMFEESAAIGPGTFPEVASRRGINTAVIPTRGHEDLARSLAVSPEWALVHLDPVSLVFIRNIPEHASLIAECRIDTGGVRAVGEVPEERPTGWRAAIGGVGRPWYSLGMGEALLALGSPGNAKPYLELAHERFPDHPPTRRRLAAVREAMGDSKGAAEVLSGLPADQAAAARFEAAGLLIAQGKLAEALPALRAAAAADRDDPRLAEVLGDTLLQLGDARAAKGEYERLLALAPITVNTLNKLGTACDASGDFPGAIKALEASLSTVPGQPQVWNLLGGAYAKSGNLQRAEVCFRKALELKPDLGPAQRNLQRVLELRK
ncbi:MAG: tetratricopeptide repeat protein [Leptolyngbya sp. PLA1]|nr:tetratricopeptide repeat protein [Leptolyngbya sp. PLA1]